MSSLTIHLCQMAQRHVQVLRVGLLYQWERHARRVEEQQRAQDKVKEEEPEPETMDGLGAMDVDDPSPEAHATPSAGSLDGTVPPASGDAASPSSAPRRSPAPASPSAVLARTALETAIQFGQVLEADYRADLRPEVRAHLKRTFGVVAFADPLAAGGEVADMAGQEARARLANELNQAILGK